MSLTESVGVRRSSPSIVVHYLIFRRVNGGIELLRLSLDGHEDATPVFSLEEEAEAFLDLGNEWRVRGFSDGEVVSLLFAFRGSINRVAPNPHLAEGYEPAAMSREDFIELLAG